MNDIYKDISQRTGGDILIGVVGPVRSGKSTFITKFMEQLVIPNIAGKNKKLIAVDELPQSAQGKTVMTTEPKFVPGEAVSVKLDKTQVKVRLIDCVGYMVDGAVGHEENGEPRMVKTPWQQEEMPFIKAAEYGTKKVIGEHSTMGVVITSDGSFTEIERKAYEAAEERVVNELKALNKPFIVIYNTVDPAKADVKKTCQELEKRYGVAVIPKNVTTLDKAGIGEIFERALMEFPIKVVNFDLPKWTQALDYDDAIIESTVKSIKECVNKIGKMSSYAQIESYMKDGQYFDRVTDVDMDMGEGSVTLTFKEKQGLFYEVLSRECGEQITDEYALFSLVKQLKVARDGYDKIKFALDECAVSGYGVVPTKVEDAQIEAPRVVKKNGQYCVRQRAVGRGMHLIKTDVRADVEIMSGSKEQCDAFCKMVEERGADGLKTEVFGRPIVSMIDEKLSQKACGMNENIKLKLKRAVNRAVNDKKSNVICILL